MIRRPCPLRHALLRTSLLPAPPCPEPLTRGSTTEKQATPHVTMHRVSTSRVYVHARPLGLIGRRMSLSRSSQLLKKWESCASFPSSSRTGKVSKLPRYNCSKDCYANLSALDSCCVTHSFSYQCPQISPSVCLSLCETEQSSI